VFEGLWRQRLAKVRRPRLKVLEAACGSANDYRSLAGCGLAAHLEYLGVDLGEKNVRNASAMFPDARFEVGNVFELPYPDGAFECTLVQDLFEHLSADGLARAVAELCRVTRRALCAGFFNLDEIPEHVIRPVEEYHWNTLSLDRVRELFEARGGAVQALHTGAVLRWQASRAETHNPNAYTLIVRFA
jgi:ubiquinone/menaquinone biosynthesis C-methylase UbiE